MSPGVLDRIIIATLVGLVLALIFYGPIIWIGRAHAATFHMRCEASWYAYGRRTASGELFQPDGLTAASRTLPFGTRLLVSYGRRSVVVRINDRGPARWTGRCLDLSRGAARALGLIAAGAAVVTIESR